MLQTSFESNFKKSHKNTNRTNIIATNFVWEQLKTENTIHLIKTARAITQ